MNAGGLTIFVVELLRFYILSGDSEDAFTGFFRVVGAVVFTHLGWSILQQGSRTVRSGSYYQVCAHQRAGGLPVCHSLYIPYDTRL